MTQHAISQDQGQYPPGPNASQEDQLERFNADPEKMVTECQKQYGNLYTLNLGDLGNGTRKNTTHNGRWVFLSKAHQIRELHSLPNILGAEANRIFFGTEEDSVGFVDGDTHRERRACMQPLLSGKYDYGPMIEEITRAHLESWPTNESVELFVLLQNLTAHITTAAVCGQLPNETQIEIRTLLPRLESALTSADEATEIERRIKSIIGARVSQCTHSGDMMSVLSASGNWNEETVRDETFSLLFTGFSTTANTISWALAELRANGAEYETALTEIDSEFRQNIDNRKQFLPHIEAIINETLRLHPVSVLNGVRITPHPIAIDGHMIPADTILVQCAYLAQRDAEVFKDPDTFHPGRPDAVPDGAYTVAPFGGGARTCLGRMFALREMRTIIAMILQEFSIRPKSLPGARREGIFMAPRDRLETTLLRRN